MDEYIGIIKLFAGNYAPMNWEFCNGQIISIANNTALFSILGTMYGGNGTTTFGLPDLRGRVPLGMGQGPGLNYYNQGQMSGAETTTLLAPNLPPHQHTAQIKACSTNAAYSQPKNTSVLAAPGHPEGRGFENTYGFSDATPDVKLSSASVNVDAFGSAIPFNNMQPYLGLNYIICVRGLFPPHN